MPIDFDAIDFQALDMKSSRTIRRILNAAARLFGDSGYQAASMNQVAREAGVSKGLLHYHFDSKEQLLLEAQRVIFRQIHVRFIDTWEGGMDSARDALDNLWRVLCELRDWSPFMVEAMSLTVQSDPVRRDVQAFIHESMAMLERCITHLFADQPGFPPPERLARLVRTMLYGVIVELAHARTPEQFAQVEQTWGDLRDLFLLRLQAPAALPA